MNKAQRFSALWIWCLGRGAENDFNDDNDIFTHNVVQYLAELGAGGGAQREITVEEIAALAPEKIVISRPYRMKPVSGSDH